MSSKLGQDFEFGYEETKLLEELRSKRGLRFVSLTWKGEARDHMKWEVRCNDPKASRASLGSVRVVFGATPKEALRKIATEMLGTDPK
jgi:hypothetical protein